LLDLNVISGFIAASKKSLPFSLLFFTPLPVSTLAAYCDFQDARGFVRRRMLKWRPSCQTSRRFSPTIFTGKFNPTVFLGDFVNGNLCSAAWDEEEKYRNAQRRRKLRGLTLVHFIVGR